MKECPCACVGKSRRNKKPDSLVAAAEDKNIDVLTDISHFNPIFDNKKRFSFFTNIPCLQVAEKIMPSKETALFTNSKTNIDIKPKITFGRILLSFLEYMLMPFGCVCY